MGLHGLLQGEFFYITVLKVASNNLIWKPTSQRETGRSQVTGNTIVSFFLQVCESGMFGNRFVYITSALKNNSGSTYVYSRSALTYKQCIQLVKGYVIMLLHIVIVYQIALSTLVTFMKMYSMLIQRGNRTDKGKGKAIPVAGREGP
jgi:hypothetical protein